MKIVKVLCTVGIIFFIASSVATAADFEWVKDFNLKAKADPSGFRAGLASRFQVGDAKIDAVLGDVEAPSDAYMAFRLGELSHQPVEKVIREYKSEKGKGWGVIAQRLGIKPGSAEFHALKKNPSLHFKEDKDKEKDKEKGKDKSKDEIRGKEKKK